MAQRVAAGTRLDTPALSKTMADNAEKFRDRMKHDEEHLGDDWENVEVEPCPKCKGSGYNADEPDDPFCMACEGTGTWFRLYYGVSEGLPYAYTEEYGVDFIKEVCKADREAFAELQAAGKVGTRSMIRPYRLPKTLEMELQARGYVPAEIRSGEYVREIANLIAKEYPDFMSVPYTNF